jgi:hypothetical protein
MKALLPLKNHLLIGLVLFTFLSGNVVNATVNITSFTSISGGSTYCLNTAASSVSAIFATCKNGNSTPSTVTVTWYRNTVNSTTGGTLVSQNTGVSTGNGTSVSYSTTPSTLTAGTFYYYVVLSNPSSTVCASWTTITSSTVQVIVAASPTITGTTPGSRCGTGAVILGATATAGTINWYSSPTGGTSLGTGSSFTTPSISVTTTYYVDATVGTCITATRTPVTATVNSSPTITSTTPGTRCGDGIITLGATSANGIIDWYAASTGGPSLGSGTSFTTPVLSSTTTYYVAATGSSCTTDPRVPVVATVNIVPVITFDTLQDICISSAPITLAAIPAGGVYSGTTLVTTGGVFTPSTLGSYVITYDYTNPATGCVAASVSQPINVVACWNGSVNNDWNNPGNWAGNTVPNSNTDILLPVGPTMPQLLAGQVYTCKNMTLESTGDKSVSGSGELKVNGELDIAGNFTIGLNGVVIVPENGAITIDSVLTVDGNLIIEDKGSIITRSSLSGNATVQLEIPNDLSWHLLSSPVSGQKIVNGVFAPTYPGTFPGNISTWDFYTWLPNCPSPPNQADHWRNLRTSAGGVNTVDFQGLSFWPTRGYLVAYGNGWQTTKTFYGPLNCCDQTCSFYDVEDICSWSLAGNPFAASVDWSKVTGKSNLVADYYYVWNQFKSGGAGYEFWKDGSHYSSTKVNGYIAPMQGFFVKVDPYGDLTLTLPNSSQSHQPTIWLKDETVPVNKLTMRLSYENRYDEAYIQFENENSAGPDRNDAEKMFSLDTSVPQIYSIVDNNQKTGLNALPCVTEGISVPVGFVAPTDGFYNIRFSGIETFSSLHKLTLEDLKLNCSIDLLQTPVYYFMASGNEDAGRFLLHFSGPIGVGEKTNSTINIYSSEKTVFITCANGFHNATVTITNLLGQEITTQQLGSQPVNRIKLSSTNGYYIVKVQDDSTVKTAKVYIP